MQKNIVLYTPEDIQKIFGLGRTNTYRLMKSDGFPSVQINKRLFVEKSALEDWLKKNRGKIWRC